MNQYTTTDTIDPIADAAASLLALDASAHEIDPASLAPMEKALRDHAIRIHENDFGGLEILLTCQTQMLHKLFAKSLSHYSATGSGDKQRLHGNIAIHSQKNCRITVRDLAQLKKSRREMEKMRPPGTPVFSYPYE